MQPTVRRFRRRGGGPNAKVIAGRVRSIPDAAAGPAIVSRRNEITAGCVVIPARAVVDRAVRYLRAESRSIAVFGDRRASVTYDTRRRVEPATGRKTATGAAENIGDIRAVYPLKFDFKTVGRLAGVIDDVEVPQETDDRASPNARDK